MSIEYHKAPPEWTPDSDNPFTEDGKYGSQWTCCIVGRGEKTGWIYGSGENSLFRHGENLEKPGLSFRIADYLRYETLHGRKSILFFPDDINTDSFVSAALSETPNGNKVRESDPKWMVHSTNLKAWESIQKDGALRALSVLLGEGKDVVTIGFDQFDEPKEFGEYIMFGRIDNVNSEHIVSSQQKGKIYTAADAPYKPGVRLYFNHHKIIKDGLAVRDGMHQVKVHKRLPLSPYLVAAVSVNAVDPEGLVKEWTPNRFWRAANEQFLSKLEEEDILDHA